ncbi:glycosyltransferase family 2 protein [Nakamurella antarctica]|uniref:Glycosyltransferase family 2 protein n=1 Tax=Nakamurella antarctica TaxID=1902245 RepID=A0A3G8ZP01_9ACTN|nr:glycosyltransferase family A protein [Nakamurella antarctica]AZI58505.1 glycosyltransferase family 2 protein [Nakamurella antarctica]
MPRVSVVVPAYNSVRFIGATIDSILAQSYRDFHLYISDHSSTDGTWEELQRYAGHAQVTLSRLPTGGGAPANWNAVTAHASSDLIKLVCGDDLVYPDCLAVQVAAFDSHPGTVMVASARDIIDAAGMPMIRGRGLAGMTGPIRGRDAVRRTILAGVNIFGEPGCVLFDRSTLLDVGGWDARFPYLIDQATYTRVLLRGDLVAIPEPQAGFRINDDQWSVALAKSQSAQAKSFHRWVFETQPGILGTLDLLRGNAMATAMALARRAVSAWLRRSRSTTP